MIIIIVVGTCMPGIAVEELRIRIILAVSYHMQKVTNSTKPFILKVVVVINLSITARMMLATAMESLLYSSISASTKNGLTNFVD